MRLNASKCKVMHLGVSNKKNDYEVEDVDKKEKKKMEKTDCEKDQGVFISKDLKWNVHAYNVASKANKILGMLQNSFICKESGL